MNITETFETTAGTCHRVTLTGAEADVIARSDLFPWITSPARRCVQFRTFSTGGFQYWSITAADLGDVVAVLGGQRTDTAPAALFDANPTAPALFELAFA